MTDEQRPPELDRTLLAIGLGLLGLVVVASLLVVVLGSSEPAQFPDDSPEGTVQRHLDAFAEDELEEAYALFSSDVQQGMSPEQYEQAVRDYGTYASGITRRVLFDRSDVDGEEATVHLTVEEFYGGGPFGGGDTYRSPREIHLVREDGAWRIDEPLVGLEPAPVPFDEFPG